MSELLDQLDPRVLAYLIQIGRLFLWLLLLAVIFTPLERLFALHPHKFFRKDVAADLFYYFLSSLTPAIALSVPLSLLAWGAHALIPGAYFDWVDGTPVWARAAAAMVIGEVGFYWGHRWSHEFPFLWGFHAVHHSAEHMDFLVNTRAHPVDVIVTRLCGLVPLYLLGLASPVRGAAGLIPVLVVLVGTMWGFFIHSNVRWRLGPMEHLIATPAFHHWHHTNDSPQLYNRNYASMLPWLDRLFGTLHLPKDRHPGKYGISEQLAPGVVGQLLGPFRKAPARTAKGTGELSKGQASKEEISKMELS